MTLTKDQIRSAALKLEPSERESLAEELLLSISESERQAIDRAWLEEVRRRDSDLQEAEDSGEDLEQVISRIKGEARK